ncbi:hypothetical protein CUR178_06012 [Leishmania enriettii]|uniref:Uncharacterized protein n=1 Tax=Leishmania enriettii TaxID=5663 RepID=A0A836KY19_LEIEN|nr:hypothetical protein CUR178_06012 [Leishmania enriettii]
MSAEYNRADGGADAASLIDLSEPLPSSVKQLGLTLSDSPLTATTATVASAAPASPSFRVRAMHLDDVAEDVILVCEDSITLFVPLMQSAAAAAAAACLRMAYPLQVWTLPLSPPCCTTASTSGLCLPRRLPMPHEEVRRSASVLIAVPVTPPAAPSLSASSTGRIKAPGLTSEPALASDHGARATHSPVMAVYIMECPVLPKGVDCIEASAVPLPRPLARIVCAPNTLRFRDAWYPVRFFCWCGSVTAATTAASSTAAASPTYADHHLLCVSSIAVDLIRVRYRVGRALAPSSPLSPQAPTEPLPLPSYGMCGPGDEGRIDRETPVIPSLSTASPGAAASPTTSAFTVPLTTVDGVCDGAALVSISVLQRYVTRSDWCTYDARSRVLLSLNHARPSVVKPIKVHVRQRASSLDFELSSKSRGGAEAGSSPLELRTCTELTLSESLCSTLHMEYAPRPENAADAVAAELSELPLPLLQSPHFSQQLSSVLGALTAYGQFWVYHVPADRVDIGDQREPVMNLYMHLPSDGPGGRNSSDVSAAERALDGGVARAGTPASGAETSESDSLFRWIAAAASLATASAPLPEVHGGTFIHAARLSLTAVISRAPRGSQAATHDLLLDAVEADEPAPPLSQTPRFVPLCVHVVDNLIVIHAPDTARSAVYDLADYGSSSVPQASTTSACCAAKRHSTTRCCVLRAVLPGATGAGLRAHSPVAVNAASNTTALRHCSSEPTISSGAEGGATRAPQAMGTSDYGPLQRSQSYHSSGSGAADSVDRVSVAMSRASPSPPLTALYPPAAASSAAQVTTTSALATELQQRHRLRDRKAAVQRQVPSANFVSMLSFLTSSILGLTAPGLATTTAATAAPAAALAYPLYCCGAAEVEGDREDGDAAVSREPQSDRKLVIYGDYQWLASPRLPLVMNAANGTVHACRVDAAGVAKWRLSMDVSRVIDQADQDPRLRQQEQGLDAGIVKSDPVCGLVRSYVSFLCRRCQRLSTDSSDGRSTNSVRALVGLLRELTIRVVGLTETDSDDSVAGAHHINHAERAEVDVLRHLLFSAPVAIVGAAGKQLYALWLCMLENLTIETEFAACCDAVERERTLGFAGVVGSAADACVTGTAASRRLDISSTELQQLILRSVFAPIWTALHSSSLPCYSEYQQQRRRRLEGLLSDYVRLLHSAAIPVESQLQHLLLEVILCDVTDTSRLLGPPRSTPVCSAAYRVQELLRQRVLEPNDATARWLLEWWGAYQQARESIRRIDTDDANARRLHARGSPAEHCTKRSGTVHCATSAPAAATATPQWNTRVFSSLFCPGDATEEAETIFEEALRLLVSNGSFMEAAEAYSGRSNFTAAAAVLQRVPQQSKFAEVPAAAPWPALPHHPQTRVLSWDSLALSVLDGAWRCLRCAEEELFSYTGGAPVAPAQKRSVSALASAPPKSRQLRLLERRVHDAHLVYAAVATALLVKPLADALPPLPAVGEAHPSQVPLSGVSSDTENRRFHAHETNYEQLRRQLQQDWQELKLRGKA